MADASAGSRKIEGQTPVVLGTDPGGFWPLDSQLALPQSFQKLSPR